MITENRSNGDGTFTDRYGRRLVPTQEKNGLYTCRVEERGFHIGSVHGWKTPEDAATMAVQNFVPHWYTIHVQVDGALRVFQTLREIGEGEGITETHANLVSEAILAHLQEINCTHCVSCPKMAPIVTVENERVIVRYEYTWLDTHHVFDGDSVRTHVTEMRSRIPLVVTSFRDSRHADHYKRMIRTYRDHHHAARVEYSREDNGPIQKVTRKAARDVTVLKRSHWDMVETILLQHMQDTNDVHRGHVGQMPQATEREHPDGRMKIEVTIPYTQYEVHSIGTNDNPTKVADAMTSRLSRWDKTHPVTDHPVTRPTETR